MHLVDTEREEAVTLDLEQGLWQDEVASRVERSSAWRKSPIRSVKGDGGLMEYSPCTSGIERSFR